MIKNEYLKRDSKTCNIEQEIKVMSSLRGHQNIVKMLDHGTGGVIVKPCGKMLRQITFITMEYISGPLLFDLCRNLGSMGEDAGRFLFG